ncbi:DUF1211 domain-containing protein [candidate division WOR-3 bacterium]|nr:DUF1211 domain-containing protein [candidate division WOR-3 bacterium]
MSDKKDIKLFSPGRIETLTDGIYAIAMTLLILGIDIPDFKTLKPDNVTFSVINHVYPQIINYVISFVILGSFWLSHHSVFDKLRKVNSLLMFAVIIFLLFSALVPFSTILIDDHGKFFISALFFNLHIFILNALMFIQFFIIHKNRNLLKEEFSDYNFTKAKRKIVFSTVLALSAIAISFFNPQYSTLVYIPIPFIAFT